MVFPRKVKGFRDINNQLNFLRWHIISKATEVYKKFGFEHWDTPILEYAEVLGKYLPEADSTSEGVYSFRNPETEPKYDHQGKELRDQDNNVLMTNHFLTLRYDLTAPLSRLYSEYIWEKLIHNQVKEGKADLFRRYQFGPVFRYEIALEPGRFREFWQLDFDTVGSDDVAVDAENIIILYEALKNIGLNPEKFLIKVNNRKILDGLLENIGLDEKMMTNVMRILDKLDKIGLEGVEAELSNGRKDKKSGAFIDGLNLDKKIIDEILFFLAKFEQKKSVKETLDILKDINIDNKKFTEGIDELEKIYNILTSLNYSKAISIDPTIIRGMGYYTGPIYEVEYLEFFRDKKGNKRRVGSICGGGRYDNLVKNLIGLKVPASGASIGVDRLVEVLLLTNQIPVVPEGPVLIVVFDDNYMLEYQKIAQKLRENNIATEIYYGKKRGLKQQLAYADKKNSPVAILLGEDEIKQNVVTVRNLKLGKQMSKEIKDKNQWKEAVQQQIPIENLVDYVKEIISA